MTDDDMNSGHDRKRIANRLMAKLSTAGDRVSEQLSRAIESKDEKAADEATTDLLALSVGMIVAQRAQSPQPPKTDAELQAFFREMETPESSGPRPIPPSKLRG